MITDATKAQISYLLDGYDCGHRSDVSYAIKCINEMWQLAASFPEGQVPQEIWDALKKMGEKYCPVKMTHERNKFRARKAGAAYTAPAAHSTIL